LCFKAEKGCLRKVNLFQQWSRVFAGKRPKTALFCFSQLAFIPAKVRKERQTFPVFKPADYSRLYYLHVNPEF
jgi:hypothetical protein